MHFVVRGVWVFSWLYRVNKVLATSTCIPVAVPQKFQTNMAKLCHLACVLENRAAGSCALLVDV